MSSSEPIQLYQEREQLLIRLAEVSARVLQLEDEKTVLNANSRQLVSALQENTRRLNLLLNASPQVEADLPAVASAAN